MNMHLVIEENGCKDKEITVLDTRLPYFYAKVRELFTLEPEEVHVILIDDKQRFATLRGEESDDGAFSMENTIYIYEPNQFGIATSINREHFYEVLYQELIYLFYRTNKNS
ncbi:hypothetical protein EXS74_00425 [Candidatus Woesearchaeota archaeon]|nr:hypothetical protein [Candidatus Woesearchaeota archaeon]